jgi:hypothetical protein
MAYEYFHVFSFLSHATVAWTLCCPASALRVGEVVGFAWTVLR